jgi:hypothetical protein
MVMRTEPITSGGKNLFSGFKKIPAHSTGKDKDWGQVSNKHCHNMLKT